MTKKFEKLSDMPMSADWAKREGYEAFEANILDLIARGVFRGYKENGKLILPGKADIRDAFEKLTGMKVEKPVKPTA